MSETIVFFYIDAFASDMLSATCTPFLFNLANKGHYQELENVIGYSFAFQSCMLSGKYPDENLHWMPYFYSPEESPMLFKALRNVGRIAPVDRVSYARYGLSWVARKLFMKKGVKARNIPLSIMGDLCLYPYYYMNELPFFHELKRLLDCEYRRALVYLGPPKVKGDIYGSLLRCVRQTDDNPRVIILYEDALDYVGHTFGPSSSQYLNHARILDGFIAETCSKILKIDEHATFLFLSDHAQSQLASCIDIISKLNKAGLKMPDDYQCFIDATVGLFWSNDDEKKERMTSILGSLEAGTLIDGRLRERYHLRFENSRMYGDLIYVLRPGWTFFPNFFSPFRPMKGLHGYLPEDEVQKSFLISNEKLPVDISHVRDVRHLLVALSS